jgi:hypothetical protein
VSNFVSSWIARLNDDSFVDRDMVMRYHWGLAIGHPYAHKPSQSCDPNNAEESSAGNTGPSTDHAEIEGIDDLHGDSDVYKDIQVDEAEEEGDEEGDDDDDDDDSDGKEDYVDEELYEMYGDSQDIEYYN